MDVEIKSKKENLLLGRMEIRFTIAHEGAPSPKREEVREAVGQSLGTPKERVVVERLRSEFGKGVTQGLAKVYATLEAAKAVERPHILVRNRLAEKVAKAAPAKAASRPRAPPPAAAAGPTPAPAPAAKKAEKIEKTEKGGKPGGG